MKSVEAPPKASTLIESMRDIGYTLETALADVVDNSITAGATAVAIWDLDHVAKKDSWTLLVPDHADGIPICS